MECVKDVKFTTFPKVKLYRKYTLTLKKKESPFKKIIHFVIPEIVKDDNLEIIFKNIVEKQQQKNCAIYIEIAEKPKSFIKFTFKDVYLDKYILIYCHSVAYTMYLRKDDFTNILANKETNINVYLK